MINLMYISSATAWPSDSDNQLLLEQARSRNAKLNITGLLLYHNATYLQLLEGEKEDVYAIFKSIQQDPRNTGVIKLLEQEIDDRSCPDWDMGFIKVSDLVAKHVPDIVDISNKKIAIENKSSAVNFILRFSQNMQSMV